MTGPSKDGRVPICGSRGVEPVYPGPACSACLDVLPFLIMGAVGCRQRASSARGPGLLQLLALGPAFAGGLRRAAQDHRGRGGGPFVLWRRVLAADQIIGTWGDYARDSATVVGVTIAAVIALPRLRQRAASTSWPRSGPSPRSAQQVLLGPVPHVARQWSGLAVRYMSRDLAPRGFGGDLYEVVTGTTGMRLIIGDVQGEGAWVAVKTGRHGARARSARLAPEAATLAMIRGPAGDQPWARQLNDEQFVTAVLAEVSPDGFPDHACLSCGHPPPLLNRGAHAGRFRRIGRAEPAAGPGQAWAPSRGRRSASRSRPDDQMLF